MRDPIWQILEHQRRNYHWLADRTGYSHSHVKAVANGIQPVTAAFRAKCAFAMDMPEHLLFSPAAEKPTADTTAA